MSVYQFFIKHFVHYDTTWNFTTSSGLEIDISVLGFGHGTFYLTDSADSSGKIYEVKYHGGGLTTGKSPVPFTLGGSGSTTKMPSRGIGPIVSYKPILTIDDFLGWGSIFTAALNIGTGYIEEGNWIAHVFFPVDTNGIMVGGQYMTPLTVGVTGMFAYFYI